MADFNVPNEFVPQSGQTISSSQMDQNFDAVELEIDRINDTLGTSSGTFTDNRKVLFSQRPAYTGAAAPAANEFIDRKYLEATRGCRVGDEILSINPNALPNDYGVVWARMEGQQLAIATYPEFYAVCQSIGGTDTGRYDPANGATAGNFVAPDWRGRSPISILAGGNALTSVVPNFAAANWLGSLIGEGAHTMTVPELVSHTHIQYTGSGAAIAYANGGGSTPIDSGGITGATGGGQPFNVTGAGFMSHIWVRIK